MSKILLIGASGTIGQAVLANLGARHDVITVGRSSGTHRADFSQRGAVAQLFEAVGKVDAIVSTAGNLHFGPLAEMTAEQFNLGLQDKLLGQVQLTLVGQKYLNDGGYITLTAGIPEDWKNCERWTPGAPPCPLTNGRRRGTLSATKRATLKRSSLRKKEKRHEPDS